MQMPPKIEFQNMSPTQEIRNAIDKHIAELEHHPASRNAVPALLEFGDMFIDGVPDLLCRIYVLKFDFGWRLHV